MDLLSAHTALSSLELIARGGGGGSSSGDGEGMGIAAIGYFPCHVVSSFFAKHISVIVGIVVGSILACIIAVGAAYLLWPFFIFEMLLVVGGAVAGVITGSQNLFGKIAAKVKKTREKVTAAASKDPAWHEASLQQTISTTFAHFQNDWTNFNVEHIKSYTTPRYYHHVSLMLSALHVMGRQNVVMNPVVKSQFVTDIHDNVDNSQDTFTAAITAKADDKLVDTTSNKIIYTDNSEFTEYWRFVRDGHTWRLDGIEQATADESQHSSALYRFATDHNMFYSLDWGWLLLPQRGQLFGQAKFKTSDVNNHVIGQWNGILVQLYTYMPVALNSNYPAYQIAQITLPKSYGGIIVKRKSLMNFTPRGYQKITFEWPDFNKRYVVYATDIDKVTSFELLNPKFMADLYDKNLKIDIEVVDNVVYLYSKVNAGERRYPEMMEVLQQAFRELKL